MSAAAQRGDAAALHRHLEASGGTPVPTDDGGRTALHWACAFDEPACVTALLAALPAGAVGARAKRGATALHVAAGADAARVLPLLLAHGPVRALLDAPNEPVPCPCPHTQKKRAKPLDAFA